MSGMGVPAGVLRVVSVVLAFYAVSPASAHVNLIGPNGGEVLEIGTVATISWQIVISHDLQNWDLWYSTDGGTNYTPIAMDLAPGSNMTGSMHSFGWIVPDTPSTQVRVRVRMDNSGMDYTDESDMDLTIGAPGVPMPAVSPVGVASTIGLLLAAGALLFRRAKRA